MVSEAFNGSGDDSQDDKKLNQTTNTGPQQLAGSQQGRVASFSNGQQGPSAAGRFTNIQKYIDANTQASGNLETKANKQIGNAFNQQQTDVNAKNTALQSAFQKGDQDIQTGQGFQNQLGNIQTGFKTGFQDFGNRAGFDTAGQQAMELAKNQDFSRIAGGQAIDENTLQSQQNQALAASQGLLGNTQKGLSDIQTEAGRDQLFSQVLAPKQGYTAGQRSFDKLFLGGALGGIKNTLQGQQNQANDLLQSTSNQGNTLSDLIAREQALTTGIGETARSSQDIFNNTLGSRANIDYVNDLRNKNFDTFMSDLKTGNVSKEMADRIGLTGVDTYIKNNQAVNTPQKSGLIGTYNALQDGGVNYFNQGKGAQSYQDIVTQPDYDVYKALQAISGRDTGQLGGTSQLDSSIIAAQGKDMNSLSKDIQAQDKAFKDQYANKDITAGGYYHVSGGSKGKGSNAESTVNFDKYIQDQNALNNLVKSRAWEYDYTDSNNNSRRGSSGSRSGYHSDATIAGFENAARANSQANLSNQLQNIVNTTGVKNALNINDPVAVDPTLQRFKGLL